MSLFRAFKKSQTITQSNRLTAQIDDSIEVRTETLLGREYLVVPVVAMVEGVRIGATADAPELGLASEFSQDIIMWANRPLVLNHPQTTVDDETYYCSANSPEILESYCFGMTMNPYVEDSKLKMEAWIDKVRVEDLGGEFSDIVDLIEAGETVEVSVGFFSTLEAKKGKFRGQSYSGIWRNIKPDHLAILSVGTLGACSIADGCGIPRINQKESDVAKTSVPSIKVDTQAGCGCGGHEESQCTCHEHEDHDNWVPEITDQALKDALEKEADRTQVRAFNSQLIAQSVESGLTDSDVRALVKNALRMKYKGTDVYLYAFTSDKVIFETYGNWQNNYTYTTYQIGANISASGVEFVGEAEEVVLLTKIAPVSMPSTNLSTQTEKSSEQENDMTTNTTTTPESTTAPAATLETQPVAQASQANQPTQLTAQAYIEQAPAEIREMLQSSMKLHSDRKNALVEKIKANSANRFSEDQLKVFDLGMLENLAALAGETVTPNYGGIAAPLPVAQAHQQMEAVPAPPRLFSVK